MVPPLFTEALDVVVGVDGLLHAAIPVTQAMARRAAPALLPSSLIIARRPSP